MGHYPKQDFYYGYLAKFTGEDKNDLYNFFEEMREEVSGENRDRRIEFRCAGDATRHLQDKGVVGVKINDKYGPGEKVVRNIPDQRDEYATDMSYLGGFHTGEFDLEAFKREKQRAKERFEEENLEEKLKEHEDIELRTAQPSIVTVSWFG